MRENKNYSRSTRFEKPHYPKHKKNPNSTSWQGVKDWYNQSVGEKGHYYHQEVILPALKKILRLDQKEGQKSSLLDLACGQGILARHIPSSMDYQGFDISPGLIQSAKAQTKGNNRQFGVADVTKDLPCSKKDFDLAAIILAIQNIEFPLKAFKNAALHLKVGGKLVVVLNHPAYRIARQSSWEIDQEQKVQYRRINSYMSPLRIPIQMQPSRAEKSVETLSFHHPIHSYINWLVEAGFHIVGMEEWVSNKVSEGGAARMENRIRKEIPMFMMLLAEKQ